MLGKRKRADESVLQGFHRPPPSLQQSSHPLPHLTQWNLHLFNQHPPSASPPIEPYPPPFQFIVNQPPATPSGSKRTKTISSITRADSILDTFRIYQDRHRPMPHDLQKLVQTLQEKRGIDVTPKSRFIEATREECKTMKEDMNLHTLADSILYRGWLYEGDDEGETLICRGRSDQWYDRVPRPVESTEESNLALQAAMKAQGLPPKPKPDLTYGYGDDAFDRHLTNKRKGLPDQLRLFSAKPWFPYLVVEWKSAEQSPRKAEQQALRDAAAAIDTLYQLFKLAHPDREPSPALTCAFSLCVHYQGFDYRIHWRRTDDEGNVSYEGDRVTDALYHRPLEVFEARGAILKTLDWVRGQRLTAIKDALRAVPSPGIAKSPSTPQLQPLSPPQSHASAANPSATPAPPARMHPSSPHVSQPPASPVHVIRTQVSPSRKSPLQMSPAHKKRRLVGYTGSSDDEDDDADELAC